MDSGCRGVGWDAAKDAPLGSAASNLPPFSRQITSTITADWFRFAGFGRIRLLQIGEYHFRMQPGVSEDDGLELPGKNLFRDSCGFVDIAAANPEISIHHLRAVRHPQLLSPRHTP